MRDPATSALVAGVQPGERPSPTPLLRHTRRVSPISTTQQGFIAECEFMKLLMLGSGGELECMAPATDDERRELEAHIRGQFTPDVRVQRKCTTRFYRRYKGH